MQYYQNLDLDKITKENLQKIIDKIKLNPCCLGVQVKDSSLKGYHVLLICKKKCDICRFVFDDMKRYEIDFNREEKFKNTLFTEKEFFRGNTSTLKEHCERCLKYDVVTTMSKRELELNEVKKKMKYDKLEEYDYRVVYLCYDYFECPICHWFKFKKRGIF